MQKVPSCSYYILHHETNLIPIPSEFIPINLNELNIPTEFQKSGLSEIRFFLSNPKPQTDYVAVVTASWEIKYPQYGKLEKLSNLWTPQPKVVYAAQMTNNWWGDSENAHPGITRVLWEILKPLQIKTLKNTSFYANNFACSKEVFEEFIDWYIPAFQFIFDQYGYNPPFKIGNYDPNRKLAYLAERLTLIYFANRNDLIVKEFEKGIV